MSEPIKDSGQDDFPEHITKLYERPQEDWGVVEWSELAAWLSDEYSRVLDEWRDTVRECHEFADIARQAVKALSDTRERYERIFRLRAQIHAVTEKIRKQNVKPRGRGRPKTIDPEEDLEMLESLRARYLSDFEKQLSLNEQLTRSFERMFKENGVRGIRVRPPSFQRKLKTIRNRISAARRHIKSHPEK